MKKSIISILAVATMALVSCNKENVPEQGRTITFTAVSETMDSKAGLAADGKSLQWTVGDKVKLFFQKTGEAGKAVIAEASVTSVATDGTATFTATVPEGADMSEVVASYNDNSGASETDLHPYYTQDGKAFTRHRVTVKKNQAAVKGGYDPATTPLVGFWKGNAGDPIAMTFKNVTALACIDLTNSSSKTIESITLSNTAFNIAGRYYYLTPSRDGFSWQLSDGTSKEITLTGTITDGKYYFALIGEPQTLSGITLSFNTADGAAVFRNPNSLSVQRNNIYNIGSFTITDASFESKPEGIEFSDTKVNMDDTFYAALANSCTATTTAGKYTLSATVEKDFIKITPKNSDKCEVYYNYSGKNYISNKHTLAFTSGSAGNALLVLYCALDWSSSATRKITLTWKDKNGGSKTVPTSVDAALTNTTGAKVYYETDDTALQLSLPGVEVGDVFSFSLTQSSAFRFYKFLWKEDTSTKSSFGAAGDAGQTGSSETYPNTL